MSATRKANSNISYTGRVIVVENLQSHENDPFFVKKVEEAKIVVAKLKLPEVEKK